MNKTDIRMRVNGQWHELSVEPKEMLLDVLRDRLKLKGTKYGCGTGDCGACKVLIDGTPKNSCVTLAVKCDNREITTIEGIGDSQNPHPIQEAMVQAHAIQCGFCTPGMVVSAKALLDQNPKPTREEIRAALKNNICRCTGYEKIVDAIELAGGREDDQ